MFVALSNPFLFLVHHSENHKFLLTGNSAGEVAIFALKAIDFSPRQATPPSS